MNSRWLGCAAAALVLVAACDSGETDPESSDLVGTDAAMCDENNDGLALPDGFCAQVINESLGQAAGHLAVAPNGDVFVALRPAPGSSGGEGIVGLRDTDADGRADQVERFGEHRGTGIDIQDGYLYFATDSSVIRYALPQDGTLVPTGEPEMIVSGFPIQRAHASKTLAFDDNGRMWVNVGAPSNNCGGATDRRPGAVGQQPCPELQRQGGVWVFDANRTGQTQADGTRYVSGIRNTMALAYSPSDGELWGLQHGRDQLDVVSEGDFTAEENATRPAEELLRLTEGTAFSWPYCFFDLETSQRLSAPEYGGTGSETADCAQYPEPVAAFGGHWAPIDMTFYTGSQFPAEYRNGAFIAFHGSWNRAPLAQEGYRVMFQPLTGESSAGEAGNFADGFAGIPEIPSPDRAAHRPIGLAEGPDGSIFISDSVDGRIWRIRYTGN